MRKSGIWNPSLLAAVARAGHGDLIVVADPGLPIPAGVPVIDLVWKRGEPAFLPVVELIASELVVERYIAATEAASELLADLRAVVPGTTESLTSHIELKDLVRSASVVVRTGESTPYANVVLQCGVPF